MKLNCSAICFGLVLRGFASAAHGDVLELQNGDRYNGKVLSLNATSVVLQNEVLGKITVPRARIATISFTAQPGPAGSAANSTNSPSVPLARPAMPGATNPVIAQLAAQPGAIKKVQDQFLAGTDAAVHDKFNEMVSGLINGTLTLEDLRREAQTNADQIRALRKDVGEDMAGVIDGYLAILDQFLREAPPASTGTNTLPVLPKRPARPEED